MKKKNFLFLLIPFLFVVIACDRADDDPVGDEMARLEAWLQVHNINVQPTSSGLYYINKVEGTGLSPIDSSYVVFSYTARSLDGVTFETTNRDTAKLYDIFSYSTHYTPYFQVYVGDYFKLKGLYEGLSYMKEGGKARLIIPSTLGYGTSSSGSIKSNSTLIYDVELIKVVTDPEAYEKSLIASYLEKHPGYTEISDNLHILKLDEGFRNCVIEDDSVVYVNYTGKFLDGYVFDTNVESVARKNNIYSSSNSYVELSFTVGGDEVIKGYSLAVKNMIEGERALVIIPSEYAYGASGKSSGSKIIQPYETLIFDIEVVKVYPKVSK